MYDLASLIDDVRIKLPTNLQKIIEILLSEFKIKKRKFNKLKNDYDILSVQRNFKILGYS